MVAKEPSFNNPKRQPLEEHGAFCIHVAIRSKLAGPRLFWRSTKTERDSLISMQQLWIHSEYRYARSGQNSRETSRLGRSWYSVLYQLLQSESVVLLLLCAFAALGLSAVIAAVTSSSLTAPFVAREATLPYAGAKVTAAGREYFLARLSLDQRRAFLNEVNNVHRIIKETRGSKRNYEQIAFSIVSNAKKAGVDPLFVAAVIKYESTFNHLARSHKGALGLMQVLPLTARYISKRNSLQWRGAGQLRDPDYNIQLGVAYLKYLERYFSGNMRHVLVAYNWGPSNLSQALKKKKRIPSSTLKYADRILSDHRRWRKDFETRFSA